MNSLRPLLCGLFSLCLTFVGDALRAGDPIRELQNEAVERGKSPLGHWGTDPDLYTQWGTHSSRLIPVYTYGTRGQKSGIDFESYMGANSLYRNEAAVTRLYGKLPLQTVNPAADYCDQTNLADLQRAALEAGKKHTFLVIFDGMDWQTTRNAAIARSGKIAYTEGRGTGLFFQDYDAAGTSQFGYMVTSPLAAKATIDVNQQTATVPTTVQPGGYSAELGGATPWERPPDLDYLIGTSKRLGHAYPDSANTASSMTSGLKTYNGSINIDADGQPGITIAHLAQSRGYAVGAVSSVPISHATPAAAYAHNVSRDDYQDLTRDLLGLPSIFHPENPLSGLDVLIGGGYGTTRATDSSQGTNFVRGNRYLTEEDLQRVDVRHNGKYVVATRETDLDGAANLLAAAERAWNDKKRLLGFYGVGKYDGHLPFQTANGDYHPAKGRKNAAEEYSPADLYENPMLADMTRAALRVLSANEQGFWLMVEAGDVDWANHDNNLDNSIGAVFSGDEAVEVIAAWVEQHSNWDESLMIVTADHGHYFFLDQPELLAAAAARANRKRPTLMAHRGLLRWAPENTLSAFSAALEKGFDVELDVYLTRDGEVVVIHDETLERTTNDKGKVTDRTLDEVKALDAGSWFDPAFSRE